MVELGVIVCPLAVARGFGLNFFDHLLARAAVPLRGTFPGGGDAV